jgi:hypothetical protein
MAARLAKNLYFTHLAVTLPPVSKVVRKREEMGGNFRSFWFPLDDPCAVAWIVTSGKTQQLFGYVHGAVGSI